MSDLGHAICPKCGKASIEMRLENLFDEPEDVYHIVFTRCRTRKCSGYDRNHIKHLMNTWFIKDENLCPNCQYEHDVEYAGAIGVGTGLLKKP